MKRLRFSIVAAVLLGGSAGVLPACNGLFEGLYDEPAAGELGFTVVDPLRHTGRIRVDATSYTDWNYIDLRNRQVTTAPVEAEAPASWDFAVHRYDAKTNGGAVAETACPDFETLALPTGGYVEDEWTTEKITVDMSHMMDGYLVYAPSYCNAELSKWLDVDTSTMPPVYTASKRIYVLRLPDGTHAALRLTGYMDDAGVKGFLTIDYRYPLEPQAHE